MSVQLLPDGQQGVELDKKTTGRNRRGKIEQGEREVGIGCFGILSTLRRVKHGSRYRFSTLNVGIIL
jgi:hypothetical protein